MHGRLEEGARLALWIGLWWAIGAAVPAPALAQNAASEPFITVNGTGVVSVPADRASISFAVETQAKTAQLAAEENATLMDAVIRALRATAVEGLRIETHGYSLGPIYSRQQPNEPPRIEEYRASNNVRVHIGDLDQVGAVLDAGIGAGANRIASLAFEASDMEAARLDAVEQAVMRARAEAEAAARAADLVLGPPLEIHVNTQVPMASLVQMRTEQAFDAAPPTPIEAGSQRVTANVTIRYGIGG
jgi:hypothetical protein